MKRLRAPIAKTPISADATAAALRKLNPAIGSPIPPPPQFHPVVQGGGDAAPLDVQSAPLQPQVVVQPEVVHSPYWHLA